MYDVIVMVRVLIWPAGIAPTWTRAIYLYVLCKSSESVEALIQTLNITAFLFPSLATTLGSLVEGLQHCSATVSEAFSFSIRSFVSYFLLVSCAVWLKSTRHCTTWSPRRRRREYAQPQNQKFHVTGKSTGDNSRRGNTLYVP